MRKQYIFSLLKFPLKFKRTARFVSLKLQQVRLYVFVSVFVSRSLGTCIRSSRCLTTAELTKEVANEMRILVPPSPLSGTAAAVKFQRHHHHRRQGIVHQVKGILRHISVPVQASQ